MRIFKIAKVQSEDMNLKTNPEVVKSAFKALENKDMEDSYGWDEWIHFLKLEQEGLPDFMLEDLPYEIVATIQGQGGWHRYHVHGDGKVTFSKSHAMDDAVEKAQQMGFNV